MLHLFKIDLKATPQEMGAADKIYKNSYSRISAGLSVVKSQFNSYLAENKVQNLNLRWEKYFKELRPKMAK